MSNDIHGQHEGRGDRNRVTRNWLNATQLNDEGQPIEPPKDIPNYTEVDAQIGTIRHLLNSGIKHIIITEHDDAVRREVLERLTDEEKALVVFSPQPNPEAAGVSSYGENLQLVEHIPLVAGDDDFSILG